MKIEQVEKWSAMFTKGCDAYRVGAAIVYDIPVDSVSPEERHRFKRAFFGAFGIHGAQVMQANYEYVEMLIDELKRREMFGDVDTAVKATMRREEETK